MAASATDDQQRAARDERRALLMGQVWLAVWDRAGRGRAEGAGSWIRDTIAPREELEYEWVWVEPYLTKEAGGNIDTYRGRQAGRALLAQFAREVNSAAAYWFDQAKRNAEATQEEWLFLRGIMQTDGWVQREATDSSGKCLLVWTKATE